MPNFNKVILMGNLTRDPEVKYTSSGTAIAKLGKGGRLVLLASPDAPPQASGLVTRGISLVGPFWFDRDAPARVVEMIAQGHLDLSRIVSHAYPLDQVNEALAAAAGLPPFQQNVLIL